VTILDVTTPHGSAPAAPRKLYRSSDGRLLGGVALGLARHLGVDPLLVRAAFALLALANGAGVLLYAAFWIVVPLEEVGDAPGRTRRRGAALRDNTPELLALGALMFGALLLVQAAGLGLDARVVWPFAAVGFGVALLWRHADESQRARWWQVGGRVRGWGLARAVVGGVLVLIGGGLFLVTRGELQRAREGLLGTAVIVTGLVLIFSPYWVRMARELTTERYERIRSQERAEFAAHVHDSVLHTLTLIQRHVDDPRTVVRLARAQERELRNWLYRPAEDADSTLAPAVQRLAAEVEDIHGVSIDVVCVGDSPLDEALSAQLQAAREAMVNAAKYAGEDTISVYTEVEPGQVTIFVRDRGEGFDLDAVPADRLGVRQSIVGRMERHGGKAVLRRTPAGGTEVQLEMARTSGDGRQA
jgi:signal transduction histidine kinase